MSTKKNAAKTAVAAEPCQKTQNDQRLACREIFGEEHPMNVIYPIEVAATGLFWLESLFEAIAHDPHATPQIKSLAEMGAYLAVDHANRADSQHEQLRDAVKRGGAA